MEEDLLAITYKDYMLLLLMITSTTATIHSCEDRCGDLSIPFPFGTTGECCLNEDFLITCNASGAFLPTSGIQVLNISLDGQLHIATAPAYDCYDENGYSTEFKYSNLSALPFPISYTQNMLTAIGCDTNAIIAGVQAKPYAAGCISYCEQAADLINGSCTGMGCCQTPIPTQVHEFTIGTGSFFGHYYVWNFSRCGYSFLVDVNSYNFSTLDLADLPISTKFSVVLDWAVRDEMCDDARLNQDTFACKANNSRCYDSHNGPGYLCKCSAGYHGNPYLPNGCQDVNECETESLNHCTYTNSCVNSEGNFTCFCPKGYHGDGRINGTGCIIDDRSGSIKKYTIIGASTTLLFLFLCICIIVLVVQKRSMLKLRKEYFKQNGGFLLQRLLFKSKDSDDVAKIIAEEELKKATNNFNKNMVIGQGGFGVVYKGILSDNRIVAIKRSKAVDKTQIEQFVNEVVVLSQIHHPHIVKILGCCLETSVPLLVYEFITNSTLFHHLHEADCIHSLTWDARLRIAEETAGALAYMHSMQIIHRDVKSANILLDDELNAKVSDFGVSRLIPFDQEQISTLVQGTLGYMDPEYFQSGILTEKSDVYSFGVVLVELLTGKKAICSDCKEKSLALYFIYSSKEDRLFEILDKRVKEEGSRREIERVAEIAGSCLRLEGEKRPTMKQVIEELQTLRHSGPLDKQRQLKFEHNSEEEKSFLW